VGCCYTTCAAAAAGCCRTSSSRHWRRLGWFELRNAVGLDVRQVSLLSQSQSVVVTARTGNTADWGCYPVREMPVLQQLVLISRSAGVTRQHHHGVTILSHIVEVT
jgi:hypothetical protein